METKANKPLTSAARLVQARFSMASKGRKSTEGSNLPVTGASISASAGVDDNLLRSAPYAMGRRHADINPNGATMATQTVPLTPDERQELIDKVKGRGIAWEHELNAMSDRILVFAAFSFMGNDTSNAWYQDMIQRGLTTRVHGSHLHA